MLSTHLFAVERLRCMDHAHQPVPREARICRFCAQYIETPEHALLECMGSPMVVELHKLFLEKLLRTAPFLRDLSAQHNYLGCEIYA